MTDEQFDRMMVVLEDIRQSLRDRESSKASLTSLSDAVIQHVGLEVIKDAGRIYGVTVASILSRGRSANFVRARHRAIAVLVDKHGWRQGDAARLFKMDHTSISYAARQGRKIIQESVDLQKREAS